MNDSTFPVLNIIPLALLVFLFHFQRTRHQRRTKIMSIADGNT